MVQFFEILKEPVNILNECLVVENEFLLRCGQDHVESAVDIFREHERDPAVHKFSLHLVQNVV